MNRCWGPMGGRFISRLPRAADAAIVNGTTRGFSMRLILTALAFALFLILATSVRYSGARMFLIVPVLFLAASLISLGPGLEASGCNHQIRLVEDGIGFQDRRVNPRLAGQANPLKRVASRLTPTRSLTRLDRGRGSSRESCKSRRRPRRTWLRRRRPGERRRRRWRRGTSS